MFSPVLAKIRLLIQILKTRMHPLSQTQHELVFKNQPLGLFGNYLIYYSVGGSGEGPLKVFDGVEKTSRKMSCRFIDLLML